MSEDYFELYKSAKTRVFELENALKESLQLQAHYARLLNQYDGGKRLIFEDSESWIQRLHNVR
jgi:hypothetical protein